MVEKEVPFREQNRGVMKTGILVLLIVLAVPITATGSAERVSNRYVAGVHVPACAQAGNDLDSPGTDDTLYSFPTPGTMPDGLAWDGSCFWLTDITDRPHIFRLDTTGQVISQIPYPPNSTYGGDLEWVGANLWLVDEEDALLFEIDPATGDSIRAFLLPDSAASDPNCFGLTWDGSYLWVSRYTDPARIYRLDTATGQSVYSFQPPADICGIAWDGQFLWGLDVWNQVVYVMNPPDSSVVASFPWEITYGMGLKWVGSYLWNVSGGFVGTMRVYKVGGLEAIAESGGRPRSGLPVVCRPNPFRVQTRVRWQPGRDADCRLAVFDRQGWRVRLLTGTRMPDGCREATWSRTGDAGQRLPAGIYFLKSGSSPDSPVAKAVLFD
jgi:hypothetical protein